MVLQECLAFRPRLEPVLGLHQFSIACNALPPVNNGNGREQCSWPCLQMWRYEGSRTLAYYLKRRDTLRALAQDMDVPEDAVAGVVLKQIMEGLVVSC